jgi:hypothetical protein
MGLKARLAKLERRLAAEINASPEKSVLFGLTKEDLCKMSCEDLLRLHRQSLREDLLRHPDPHELARLRRLPYEEILRLHRQALGLADGPDSYPPSAGT